MARQDKRKDTRRRQQPESLPFTTRNYQILAAGIVTIILGYIALAQEPWDGFWPLVAAPILLVLGYCVVVPYGILYRKKEEAPQTNTVVEAHESAG